MQWKQYPHHVLRAIFLYVDAHGGPELRQQQPDQQGVAVGESGGQVPVDLRVGGQQPPTQQRAPVNGHLSGLQHSTESKHSPLYNSISSIHLI